MNLLVHRDYSFSASSLISIYADREEKPLIETTKNAFRITLPNVNAKYEELLQSPE